MRLPLVVGAALMLAPAVGLADQTQTAQPSKNTAAAVGDTNANARGSSDTSATHANANTAANANDKSATMGQSAGVSTQKLLPKDATLVGVVDSTDVRTFPEQMGKGENSGKIEKEGVVGVGATDRVWTTKQPYSRTVSYFEQRVKGNGIESIAKTTTKSSTAWNLRMPDGHIANVVVRNTQPTTIEAVQLTAMAGSATEQDQQQQQQQNAAPTPKTKSNTNLNSNNPSGNNPSNDNLK